MSAPVKPASRSSSNRGLQKWTSEQDAQLNAAVLQEQSGCTISWQKIADRFPGKTRKDCRKRWHYYIAQRFQRGSWSEEEDARLRQSIQQHGTKWSKIAAFVGTRNGDQCYKRWTDTLDPQIDRSPWRMEEDALLLEGVRMMGRNWKEIVNGKLPCRSGLAAKNRYSFLQRQMEKGQPIAGAGAGVHDAESRPNSSVLENTPESIDLAPSLDIDTILANLDGDTDVAGLSVLDPGLSPRLIRSNRHADFLGNSDPLATGFLPISNPHPSPARSSDMHDWRMLDDSLAHGHYNGDIDWGQPGNNLAPGESNKRHSRGGSATVSLAIRATCQLDKTESVMGELTKTMNGMTVRRQIESYQLSVDEDPT